MSVPQSIADVLRNHVVLGVESIDRMYLNVYVPQLQATVYRTERRHNPRTGKSYAWIAE